MFEHFTEAARKAVALANQETMVLGGCVIGDVELLLGLTKVRWGAGRLALDEMGVDVAEVRRQLAPQPRELNPNTMGRLPQTAEFRMTIEAAIAIAGEAGRPMVGTGEMLLGLLQHPHFPSARILADHRVSFDRAAQAVAALHAAGGENAE